MKATKGLGQRDVIRATKNCFIFDSQFFSKRSAESVMYVVAYIIDKFKTDTKGLCQDTIENMTKYCPGGSYLMLKINYVVD